MNPLDDVDIESLSLVKYPDSRLRGPCRRIEVFDDRLTALAERMFDVMYRAGGVGLAATQVGLLIRVFVANPTQEESGERVYVNPEIIRSEGAVEAEEGCLSLPGVTCRLKRAAVVTIRAQDLSGKEFEETGEEIFARILQHETDHLEGTLLIDRMSPAAKIANRQAIKELETSK